MRQINNTQELKQKVVDFNKLLFKDRQSNFQMPAFKLKMLEKKIASKPGLYAPLGGKPILYLQKIRRNYQQILSADQDEIAILIKQFDKLMSAEQITEKFWEAIVEAMRYEALRDREFLKILNPLKIKTCIYCHSQLTLTIEKAVAAHDNPDEGILAGDIIEWTGKLELDHKYPKSKYPFLCTSFYNLYPVCGSCNKAKSNKSSDFFLYHTGPQFTLFKFALSNDSVINYWADKNPAHIKLVFNHIDPNEENDKKAKTYDDMFSISKIYDTQKDIIVELIHKQQVYTKEYNETLINNFNNLFPDQGMLSRLIIGTYVNENDVFKRPMSKFIQDISRDINLIDEDGNLCSNII
ncbi:hypothetical protein GM921_00660 [Pedobacter sp. LMG 31464]|uniref:HNH endonuclease n=1 Tax=Pedobacter planticolens TaxID=2679964 RepID=A0A923DVT9_9SPHI|nr:hypothetical protein [Pedobacter planticolens]MBB2143981.1 hypothetical protein [Pedobacter planticolens]